MNAYFSVWAVLPFLCTETRSLFGQLEDCSATKKTFKRETHQNCILGSENTAFTNLLAKFLQTVQNY